MPGALAQPSANVPCVNRDQLNHEKKKNEGQKRQRNWVKVISHHNDFCKWVGR